MRTLLLLVALLAAVPASRASAQEGQHRVLFVPAGSVPARVRRTVERLLASRAVMVSYDQYARATSQQDLYPSNIRAIRTVGTQQGADVIVVASYGGHYRRRVLTLRYYSGSTGELVTRGSHVLRGQNLRGGSQHSILRDLDAAASGGGGAPPPSDGGGDDGGGDDGGDDGGGGGDGDLPPPMDWDEEEGDGGGSGEEAAEDEGGGEEDGESEVENRQFGFALLIGAGIAQRSSTVPMMAGPARLTTIPFPAIQARILAYVRPDPEQRFRVSLAARYTTSVGLQGEDQLADGTTRTTDMRSHHLTIGLRTDIPLAPGDYPTELMLEAGWAFRMLDSEIMVSIPDYALHGIYARVGLFFPIGDTPLTIGLVPEVGHMMNLSEELTQSSMVGDGFHVGAEAHVRLQLIPEVSISLMYRESHAFLGTGFTQDLSDVERYGTLRGEYRF